MKVFILAGQSNMEGHGMGAADGTRNGGRGSLEDYAKGAGRAKHLRNADGQWIKRDAGEATGEAMKGLLATH